MIHARLWTVGGTQETSKLHRGRPQPALGSKPRLLTTATTGRQHWACVVIFTVMH